MRSTYPAAVFRATREGLLGPDTLRATAEIARGVCRVAERMVSVSALTATGLRRIDGWIGAVGVVTHAAAGDRRCRMLGSVCDRHRSPEAVAAIVGSLVVEFPDRSARAGIEMPTLAGLAPASVSAVVESIAVVAVRSVGRAPSGLVIAAADGLLIGELVADRMVRLEPVERSRAEARLVQLVGEPSRSVRDLLGGD